MVPERQVPAFGSQATVTSRRQLLEPVGLRRGELNVVGDEADVLSVVSVAATL